MPSHATNVPTRKIKLMLDTGDVTDGSDFTSPRMQKHTVFSPVIKGSYKPKNSATKSSSLSSLLTCCISA